MSLIILPIFFLILFFVLGCFFKNDSVSETIIKSILTFCLLLLLITEFTGIFEMLNYTLVFFFWIFLSLSGLAFLIYRKKKARFFALKIAQRLNFKKLQLCKTDKILIGLSFLLLLLVFIQGLIYPPNNNDALSYHMPRVISWISHQTIDHYPTHIYRQIYQPPFAEFVILHFNLLSNSDLFSNSVQFIFLLFCIITVVSIVKIFPLRNIRIMFPIVLTLTISSVIFQASNTKNDIVVSFFILATIFYTLKLLLKNELKAFFWIGISAGLALITKGTAYVFLGPVFIAIFIFFIKELFLKRNLKIIKYSMIAFIICVSVNSGVFLRNHKQTNSILGTDKIESKRYSNQEISPVLIVSNIIKNINLHIGPYPLNKISERGVYKIHSFFRIDINDPKTNFDGWKFRGAPTYTNYEDTTPNFFHFFLIVISIVIVLKNKKKPLYIQILSFILLLQIIFFCGYLKWQPIHTRLHIPIFLSFVPFISYAFYQTKKLENFLSKLLIIMLLYSITIVLFNYSRPFVSTSFTSEISAFDNRLKKYFSNSIKEYESFKTVQNRISNNNYINIGLIIHDGYNGSNSATYFGLTVPGISV